MTELKRANTYPHVAASSAGAVAPRCGPPLDAGSPRLGPGAVDETPGQLLRRGRQVELQCAFQEASGGLLQQAIRVGDQVLRLRDSLRGIFDDALELPEGVPSVVGRLQVCVVSPERRPGDGDMRRDGMPEDGEILRRGLPPRFARSEVYFATGVASAASICQRPRRCTYTCV